MRHWRVLSRCIAQARRNWRATLVCGVLLLLLLWHLTRPASPSRRRPKVECDPNNNMPMASNVVASVCNSLKSAQPESLKRYAADKKVCDITPMSYLRRSCTNMWRNFVLDEASFPAEELQVSIAFAILVYDDVWQFERLLRAVYRPHHVYCVHVDMNSSPDVMQAVQHLANCFKNIVVPTKRVIACRGCSSELDAEILCMRELLSAGNRWTWFINLHSYQFPVKSMWHLTRVLKLLNHTNSIYARPLAEHFERGHSVFLPEVLTGAEKMGIQLTVGATSIIAVREFVQYVVSSTESKQLQDILRFQPNSHAIFYGTLNYSPSLRVPGGASMRRKEGTWMFINRLRKAETSECLTLVSSDMDSPCARNMWSVYDFAYLTSTVSVYLFVEDVYWDQQHFLLDCLENWFWQRFSHEINTYASEQREPPMDMDSYTRYVAQFQ